MASRYALCPARHVSLSADVHVVSQEGVAPTLKSQLTGATPSATASVVYTAASALLTTLPWRVANVWHVSCSPRDCSAGLDFYGRPTNAIWFHIPRRPRIAILVLICLCVII